VERLSRVREEATGWRYGPGRDLGRGQGPPAPGQRAEGGRGRADARKSPAQKKCDGGWGGRRMRYPASEKLEIIRLVEQSHRGKGLRFHGVSEAVSGRSGWFEPISQAKPVLDRSCPKISTG